MNTSNQLSSTVISLNEPMPDQLQALRNDSLASFQQHGFPGPKEEAWRFTDVSDIADTEWQTAAHAVPLPAVGLPGLAFHWQSSPWQVIVVDGQFVSSNIPAQAGLQVGSLKKALQEDPEQVMTHLGAYAGYEGHPFTALNTAMFSDGLYLRVAADQLVGQAIQVFYIQTTAPATAIHPRSLYLFDRGSQATVIETFVGLEKTLYFMNPVSEWVMAENSHIRHCKIQDEAADGYHVSRQAVFMERDSAFQGFSISFGAKLERNDLNAIIAGENVQVELNGLYMLGNEQHVDHHTAMLHRRPHSFSRQLYKGILSGSSRAVFNGRIHVSREAQQTDAIQSNRNLLLSDSATINTQPQLEIYADDVRCTHGGTVGQLDEEGLFYLQTRGLSRETARNLMVHAFAGDVVQRIREEGLRERIEERVKNYLGWDERS